jgi:DNA-binding NarL/FixJ family response regulator
MATYVSPLRSTAYLSHIGNENGTACRRVYSAGFIVTDAPLPGRTVCARCTGAVAARISRAEQRAKTEAARDALIVQLLRDGASDATLCRRLRLGQRTMSRYVNDAMRRAGARTRFEWGYMTGRQET